MPTITSMDGTTIGYDKTGQGPPLILVDGAMAHRDYRGGRPLAAALSDAFTVVTYDRRGRGESTDRSPYAVAREIEDIEVLLTLVDGPVSLYGFSSGAVLALRAAAALRERVARLALLEPPFGGADDDSKREFAEFAAQLTGLVRDGKHSEAVTFFLQGMLPPEVLEGMKGTPDWAAMVAVARTLAYDVEVLGDGAVPAAIAQTVSARTLVLDGSESEPFKRAAADTLAAALPRATRQTLAGQDTLVPPDVLAPVLRAFLQQGRP